MYVEGQGDVNYLKYVDIFFIRTAKGSTTVTTMRMDEHVMNMLTHEILAFEMRSKKNF